MGDVVMMRVYMVAGRTAARLPGHERRINSGLRHRNAARQADAHDECRSAALVTPVRCSKSKCRLPATKTAGQGRAAQVCGPRFFRS